MNEMDCKELVEAITAYLDGNLSDADRHRFENHLVNCPYCTDYLEQMRTTVARLRNLDDIRLSEDVRERLLVAFRGWRTG